MKLLINTYQYEALPTPSGLPAGLVGKEPACTAVDPDSIPGAERSPGEGNGNPFQYSCLENLEEPGGLQSMELQE